MLFAAADAASLLRAQRHVAAKIHAATARGAFTAQQIYAKIVVSRCREAAKMRYARCEHVERGEQAARRKCTRWQGAAYAAKRVMLD